MQIESVSLVRQFAYQSLLRCEKQSRYSNIELEQVLKNQPFSPQDKALFTTLLYGVIERRLTLDAWLFDLCERPYESLDLKLRVILRLGAYQLYYLDRVPNYAAIDESVKICKKELPKAAPFVNAVLRSFLRKKDSLSYPDPQEDPDAYLSIRYSVSPQLCALWRADYGFARTEQILKTTFSHPSLSLRVNTLKTTREALLTLLNEQGISAKASPCCAFGIQLQTPVPVSQFTPLQQGLCYVQDIASQCAVDALGAEPGQTVLDACACPGGKSFALAMQMQNQGVLYSCDLHDNKLSLIEQGAKKLGITCLSVKCQNAMEFQPAFFEKMDRVLCDVPCSGLGVLAKKPDLRYKSAQEWQRLPAIQKSILENCARYVKKGGALLYSTCTLRKKENEEVVYAFLSNHSDFILEKEHTFFPDVEGADGFFYALFQRQ